MNLITILLFFIYQVLALVSPIQAGIVDAFGDVIEIARVEEPMKAFSPMYQINNTKEILDAGFNGNVDRSYGRNSWWYLPNDEPRIITNGFPTNPAPAVTIKSRNNFGIVVENNDLSAKESMNNSNYAQNEEVNSEVDKRLPEGVHLFDRLKEVNTIKAEGKLPSTNETNGAINRQGASIKDFKSNEDINIDVDPDVVKQFPNGFKLLNLQRDLKKLKENDTLSFGGNKTVNRIKNNDVFSNRNTLEIKTSSQSPQNGKHGNINDDIATNSKAKKKLKAFSKQKFFYQAKPVVPENERIEFNETIFYIE